MADSPVQNVSNRAVNAQIRLIKSNEAFIEAVESAAGKEYIKAVEEYNEVLKIAKTIEQADIYAAKTRKAADDDAAKAMAEVQRQLGIANKATADSNALLDERSAKLTSDIAANDGRKVELDGREEVVGKRELMGDEIDEKQQAEHRRITNANTALDTRAAALATAEADLKARTDRIAAAVA